MASEYLTIDEVAKRLRISAPAVRRKIASRQLTAHRFHRVFRVKATDLEEYEQRCRIEAETTHRDAVQSASA